MKQNRPGVLICLVLRAAVLPGEAKGSPFDVYGATGRSSALPTAARALSRAGGVRTRVLGQRMSRAPLFVFSDLSGATRFVRWIEEHRGEFQEVISQVSGHARLVELKPVVLGRHVHLIFLYETGDAAGQNMTTSCTWHACQWPLEKIREVEGIEIENFVVEANMSSDKKVS